MNYKNKVVIVVSSGNSGGGALHDYLLCRDDFISPFQGEEFRLITDPYGINNLENKLFRDFTLNNSSEAFYQYEKYCFDLQNLRSNNNKKLIYGENFFELSKKYLNNICLINYKGIPQFKSISLNFKENLSFKLKKKFLGYKNHEHGIYEMKIPVSRKKFDHETKKYLISIFKSNCKNFKNKNIILDQATSFWKPEIANNYFDNLKVVIVTRDPRSVFYSMKFRGSYAYPGYNLEKFVRWYDEIFKKQKILQKQKPQNVINIEFEKFFNNSNYKLKLEKFLKVQSFTPKNFDFNFTKNNIYKAKKNLSKYELNFIERKLKKYLQW